MSEFDRRASHALGETFAPWFTTLINNRIHHAGIGYYSLADDKHNYWLKAMENQESLI